MKNWELFDTLCEVLGGELLATELCKALSYDLMNDALEYIARNYEVAEWDEDEDEE